MLHCRLRLTLALGALAVCLSPASHLIAGEDVREPSAAGKFYPASGPRLTAALDALIGDALPPRPERPIAVLVPHAGYIYSGQIAADAFRQAGQHQYETVVILGTAHVGSDLGKIAVYPGDAFRTPLGTVPVDAVLRTELLREAPDCVADAKAHAGEHSVEVQVPFVQHLFPAAKILPIVVGEATPSTYARFGRALAKVASDRQVLIVASSDLSHYASAADAVPVDRGILESVAALDTNELIARVREGMDGRVPKLATAACGAGAIAATLTAAFALGATRGTVVSYANSADVPVGDPSSVVGYGAVVITAGERGSDVMALKRPVAVDSTSPLQDEDRRALLTMARETITRYLTTDTVPLVRADSPRLLRSSGVFVTLRKRGQVRGCVGQVVPTKSLSRLTGLIALQAANDPRLPKLRAEELPEIQIEVSVLSPPRKVPNAAAIVLGRDGVFISKNRQSAAFLPSVAIEEGWTREELLENLCVKAGLPEDGWRSGAQLLVFQAEVFTEDGP
jgi:MEMO1 family protein